MAEFKAFAAGVEVTGEVIQAFLAGFPAEARKQGLAVLERHGISSARPGAFYPLQAFLDSMKEISDKFSGQMLYRIGTNIASNAVLPPEIYSIEGIMQAVDVAFHMNHRGGEIGHYEYEDLGETHGLRQVRMVCRNPYPCAFDWGVLEGFALRFRPPECVDVLVKEDETTPCRKKGSEFCAYIISWL